MVGEGKLAMYLRERSPGAGLNPDRLSIKNRIETHVRRREGIVTLPSLTGEYLLAHVYFGGNAQVWFICILLDHSGYWLYQLGAG